MNALGMIETRGLIAAVEACDVMLKTADVSLVGLRKVKAGLVTILIQGDVAAVKASVDAGSQAADLVTSNSVISTNIIARPNEQIEIVYRNSNDSCKNQVSESDNFLAINEEIGIHDCADPLQIETNLKADISEVNIKTDVIKIDKKEDIENLILDVGIDRLCTYLERLSVTKLRKIVRQYTSLSIPSNVSSTKKDKLISVLYEYYLNK